MADPTPYFVDPNINVNGGAGTVADPWTRVGGIDVVQNGVNQIVAGPGRDAANGDKVNVKSGADDITTAVLNLAAYGAPAVDAPFIVRGYDNAENDRGIGGMDGNAGGWSIFDGAAGATDYMHVIDMHLHNVAAANVCTLRDYSEIIRCEMDTGTLVGAQIQNYGVIGNCNLHDLDSSLLVGGFSLVHGNYLVAALARGMWLGGQTNIIERNIVITEAVGTEGMVVSAPTQTLIGNSFFSTVASQTAAIDFDAATHYSCRLLSNLFEGFSGVGGNGVDFGASTRHIQMFANNSFYDNTDDVLPAGDADKNYDEDNELAMAASPFLKEGAMTFANRFNWFKPAIPVRGTAFPNGCRFDRGAVQVRLATERTIAEQTVVTIPERTVFDPVVE